MTRRNNSRIAGAAYLLYFVFALPLPALDPRVRTLFTFLGGVCALVLGVTLYGITRDVDNELALLGLSFRVTEGVLAGVTLMTKSSSFLVGGSFFAVGSTFFSYLLYRGRIVPRWLGILGVVGSALIAVAIPLQMADFVSESAARFTWGPIAIFEITVAIWLLIKGAAPPQIPLNERS